MTNDERAWAIRELAALTYRLVNGESMQLADELQMIPDSYHCEFGREVLEIEVTVPPHSCGNHVIDVLEDLGCEIA